MMAIGLMWNYQVVELSGVPEQDETTLNPFGLIGHELVAVTMVAAMVEPSLADLHQHDGAQARQQHRKRYFMTLLSLRHQRHPSLRMAKGELRFHSTRNLITATSSTRGLPCGLIWAIISCRPLLSMRRLDSLELSLS
jgi:hypothetical protein